MKTSFKVNGEEIEFKRNWFTGHFTYTFQGITRVLESGFDLGTHHSISLTRNYDVNVSQTIITVVKTRPLFFAGFRSHRYEFFIDGKLVHDIIAM